MLEYLISLFMRWYKKDPDGKFVLCAPKIGNMIRPFHHFARQLLGNVNLVLSKVYFPFIYSTYSMCAQKIYEIGSLL